ncbi:MAG TPA: DUF2752 domain-containing protein [Clostridiaceae bacterium]|nr:DUF2752 domain-containing protein [Clostridiaceae bacterium]
MNKKKRNSIIFISILAIIACIGAVIVKKYNPEEHSFFIPCIFYKLTGIKCAGCGMTRAIHNLLNGRIKEAIWYNLMLLPSAVIFSYSTYRYLRYIIKDEPIVNKPLDIILKIFLVVIIIFMIARNMTTLFY